MTDTSTTPTNHLVTGPPRSGKNPVIRRTVDHLDTDLSVGGLSSPEVRADGERVGFELRDVASGETATLAATDRDAGPTVGRYRVDVESLDRFATDALRRARDRAAVVVIDEIAPMQVLSSAFVAETRRALESPQPVLGAVAASAGHEFVAAVTERSDTRVWRVDEGTRDEVPVRLADRIETLVD